MSRFLSFHNAIGAAMFGMIHIGIIQIFATTYVNGVSNKLKQQNAPADAFVPIENWHTMNLYEQMINMPTIMKIKKN